MTFQLWPPTRLTKIVESTGDVTVYFHSWLQILFNLLQSTLGKGYTGTVATAKLTSGGVNGSMTFTNGVVTAQVAAT